MTCKVSFFNSIRENLKHHIASTFASAVVFFIQFLVFFLRIQNIANDYTYNEYATPEYIHKDLLELTCPSYAFWAPVAFISVVLAFDYFRYLHSKKQMDFYECLPIKRSEWFVQKTLSSLIVFLVPYLTCTLLECVVLLSYGYNDTAYFLNILFNIICMVLLFAITWVTAVLAMVMTGHPVIAAFGFAIFCGYAPCILRYIFPSYAEEFFETFIYGMPYYSVGNYVVSSNNLIYLSPIGLATQIIGDYYNGWIFAEHTKDLFILVILTLALFLITYKLFIKRPSEAAGRAMAFEKVNPIIRIALVIPLSLYLGLYLSTATDVGAKVWMVIGFLLGVTLLHGIIESIYQFDIRGLWSHKLQMLICFIATFGIAFTFWIDLFGYDTYIPEYEDIDAIVINANDSYFYNHNVSDGVTGEAKELAYELVSNIVKNPFDREQTLTIRVTHVLKNGKEISRRYRVNASEHIELIDKLYVTEDFKNDICALYTLDYDKVTSVNWNDHVQSYPLLLSDEQKLNLFHTYLKELTPLSYSDISASYPVGDFEICYKMERFDQYETFYVFDNMVETIALLESFLMENELTKDYGTIDGAIFEKYDIRSIDLYCEDNSFYTKDPEVIAALKEYLIYEDEFYKKEGKFDDSIYFSGSAEVYTYEGTNYVSIVIEKEILAPYIN